MKQTRKQEIIRLLNRREYSPADLQKKMGVSLVTVHHHLKELCQDGYVEKWGRPPSVIYRLVPEESIDRIPSDVVENHFVFKDPVGNILVGSKGFLQWSRHALKQKTLYEKVLDYEAYIQKLKEQNVHVFSHEKEQRLREEVGEPLHIKKILFLFPYALPDFGKTKEYLLLERAKEGDSRNKKYAEELIALFFPALERFVQEKNIDAVAFVPPSASREFQIMSRMKKLFSEMKGDMPIIPLKKKHGETVQQQKNLKYPAERLENADKTFYIPTEGEKAYHRVLLVDDFVGSGATLNQIAKKMISQGVGEEVFGITIIGSMEKKFPVVRKV
ncbi:MAG: winged helix-turn-helix transcriptional regulator [Candidatus Kaiserbacteria bacterium]|nr:winged helix-turn-helix transcriptional regulator [Candidatus Kaiserbacteria bacterium]